MITVDQSVGSTLEPEAIEQPDAEVFWVDGLERIKRSQFGWATDRLNAIEPKLQQSTAAIASAEGAVTTAQANYMKYGPRCRQIYQRALSTLRVAQQSFRANVTAIERLQTSVEVAMADQVVLRQALTTYLQGGIPDTQCGSVRLRLAGKGRLHIHFNLDAQPASETRYDGHFVVKPDGYMAKMRFCQ